MTQKHTGLKFSTAVSILCLILILFTAGCNAIQEDFERGILKETDDVMESTDGQIQREKIAFIKQIRKRFSGKTDLAYKQRLMQFKEAVLNTSSFLDSLRRELSKLDDMDVKNVEFVKGMFVYQGMGDSIQNKMKRNTLLAEGLVVDPGKKSTIRSLNNNLFKYSGNEWNMLNFGFTGPLGAHMILNGIEDELYKICETAL